MTTTPEAIANPYVGPRTFTREQRRLYFGREREAQDLLARVLSERLVLFYAQSGAGKSSLINTRLIPDLWSAGYASLPVARVGGDLPAGVTAVDNIFLFNLMLSLDQSGANAQRLASLTLSEFLAGLSSEDGKQWAYTAPSTTQVHQAAVSQPYVLIIDQFEEVITGHPGRWEERTEFFRQLNQAMLNDPDLWVVLTLREDYIAPIEPYAPLMADRMRARFYMERMGIDAALDAVRKPAELDELGPQRRSFASGVAEKLVDNLRQIRVPGQEATIAGQYVEPVQLQVVCYQLWENLGRRPGEAEGTQITLDDLAEAGNVDQALTQFYEETLAVALADPAAAGISERQLRSWFDGELITEAGARGLVHQGQRESGGLPNGLVRALQKRFLVRAETRGGDTWIELVHDRFVEPIRANNAAWFPVHLSALQRQAALWDEENRPSGLLLQDQALAEAEAWASAHENELEPHERDFLDSCRQARAAVIRERRQSRLIRVLGVAALVISVLAIGAAVYAWKQTQQAVANAELAEARIARVGQLVGDLGGERLLSMAGQLDAADDTNGAITLLQTAVDLNPALLNSLSGDTLTADSLRLLSYLNLTDKQGRNYAFVPAGAFTMGSDAVDMEALDEEKPAHPVYLDGFWIGRIEVTNDQYAAFVEATGYDAPYTWENGNLPAVNVSWYDAVAFTQWLSEESGMTFRLCSEAEWEKACRGTNGFIYPWGDEFDASKANTLEDGPGKSTPAGTYSPDGDSPYGVSDMAGNVWEWVADWYAEDYYSTSPADNPQGPEYGASSVLRGGSFGYDAGSARCASRNYFSAVFRIDSFGLRVCVSPGL